MTAIRLPVSFSLAWLATVTLFWFLGVLIADVPDMRLVPTVGPISLSDRLVPEIDPVTSPPRKPPPPKPELPPEMPGIPVDPLTPVLPGFGPSPFGLPELFGPGGGGLLSPGNPGLPSSGGSDRSALPQLRIEPDYPQLAKARGIEGWITFRFTVTREGRVKDVVIVDSEPPHVWDTATIRAVSNWRYQPRLQDGVPVEQEGVTATYRFELDR